MHRDTMRRLLWAGIMGLGVVSCGGMSGCEGCEICEVEGWPAFCDPKDPEPDAGNDAGTCTKGSGCGQGGAGGTCEMFPPDPEIPTPNDTYPDDNRVWIAYNPNGGCSQVQGWTASPAFSAIYSSGELGRYCIFTWNGPSNPMTGDTDALIANLGNTGISVEPSRRAIFPQSIPTWMHDTFMDAIEPIANIPFQGCIGVRVELLDTKADAPPPSLPVGTNRHGDSLEALISELEVSTYCNKNTSVRPEIAMPRRRNLSTNTEELVGTGGDYGNIDDLVRAADNVSTWRLNEIATKKMNMNSPMDEKLVVNLSLGLVLSGKPLDQKACDSSVNGCAVGDLSVLQAMRLLSCHGALIIASAGNSTGGPMPSTGLLAPGAFQDFKEPNDDECRALMGIDMSTGENRYDQLALDYAVVTSGHPLRPPYIPTDPLGTAHLLHAVGALDHHFDPILLTRPQGCPHFAALGLGWMDDNGMSNEPMLTGTSVSAAVVSAFAARAIAKAGPNASTQHPLNTLLALANPGSMAFDARGPCSEDPWICQNEVTTFGLLSSTPGPGQNNPNNPPWTKSVNHLKKQLCPMDPPHCIQPAGLPFGEVFSQPGPRGCISCAISTGQQPTFFIHVMDDVLVTEITLVRYRQGNIDTYHLEPSVQFVAGQTQEFQLDKFDIKLGDKVMVSGFDSSYTWSLSDQVMVVYP